MEVCARCVMPYTSATMIIIVSPRSWLHRSGKNATKKPPPPQKKQHNLHSNTLVTNNQDIRFVTNGCNQLFTSIVSEMEDFRKSKKDNPFPINNENGQKLLLFDVNPRSIQGQTCRRAMNYNSCLNVRKYACGLLFTSIQIIISSNCYICYI